MELIINREGNKVSSTHRECTSCNEVFEISSKTVTLCKICNCKRVKSQSLEKKMFTRCKTRARDRGLEFNIDIEDIFIPEACPILEIPLKEFKGKAGGRKDSPALDRIDNSKGYVKGNIMVISHLANMMKSSANPEELLIFSRWVINNYSESQ
jgi:hypothetical protein